MIRGAFKILFALFMIFVISACAQPTRLEKDYGRSIKQAQSNQTLNPEAEKNLEPVTGLDGKAAQASIEKYRKAFDQPREASEPMTQKETQAIKVKE
jgi:PBP1b-binding outer membrane lipoprotein LpoB